METAASQSKAKVKAKVKVEWSGDPGYSKPSIRCECGSDRFSLQSVITEAEVPIKIEAGEAPDRFMDWIEVWETNEYESSLVCSECGREADLDPETMSNLLGWFIG